MLLSNVMIFVILGYNVGINGFLWKRNSVQKLEIVADKKSQIIDREVPQVIPGKDLSSAATGNVQYQQEEHLANGTVVGKYGILEPSGKLRLVSYTAEKEGIKPNQETAARFEYVAEDSLKNVDPKNLKLHNQLADFNSIKDTIVPTGDLKFEDTSSDVVPEKFFDVQGYASSYRPYSSCCGGGNVYHSKYYPDYYPGNTYVGPSSGSGDYSPGGGAGGIYSGSGGYYPVGRGYGVTPTYSGFVYNTYGPTLPTKYHHSSQLYPPTVEPPPIPNYYPLYDVPTPRIPTVSSYPCCSG